MDGQNTHTSDGLNVQRSDGLMEYMTGRTGGGLRHRRKEKRGVAYNTYDQISNGVVHSVESIVEYNRGASAIGVNGL